MSERATQRAPRAVLPLSEARDAARVGNKAAALGVLLARGHRVPAGFVVTAEACATVNGALPPALRAEIAAAMEALGDGSLAVRSSATVEDGRDASFAGQLFTALHVRGVEAVARNVVRCVQSLRVQSLRAPAVRRYRADHGEHREDGERADRGERANDDEAIAVLVQRMVPARSAGVAFSIDPTTGDRRVTINAVRGLADELMSGERAGETWRIGDAQSTAEVTRAPDGHEVLDEHTARAVAELTVRVAAERGCEQDIEWAIADDELYLLQARPVTAAPLRPRIDDPEEGTWLKDEAHYPGGVSAFGASTFLPALGDALGSVAREMGLMIDGLEQHYRAGEIYGRPIPLGGGKDRPAPPWWLIGALSRLVPPMRRRMKAAQRAMQSGLLDQLPRQWRNGGREAFERRVRALAAVDRQTLELEARMAHLDEVLALLREGQLVHFRLFIPWIVEMHAFCRAVRELLGWDDQRALALLAGCSRTSTAPTRELTALAAKASDAVRRQVAADNGSVVQAIARHDAQLADEVAGWLERWGLRASTYDTGAPTLAEQPGLLESAVRDAFAQPDDGAAPSAQSRAQQALLARARDELSGSALARFERVLARARDAFPLREDNVLYTDNLVCGLTRRALLAVGEALAERGQLDAKRDAAELTLDEVRRAAADARQDMRATASRRLRERAWIAAHPGPPLLNGPALPPPDLRALPRAGRIINEALIWAMAHEYSTDVTRSADPRPARDALQGFGAWPGTLTGRVCVVRSEADLARLRRGDVMVAPVTVPAWSVAFGRIGALVTDTGGALSHAAIVAREYGIPTVLDTRHATRTLRDGQRVTVDGARGTVTVHDAVLP